MVLIEKRKAKNSLCNYIAVYIIVINISNAANEQTDCYNPVITNGMLTAVVINNGFRATVISTIPLVGRV